MWTEQFQGFLSLMLMAAMLRLSYDLGRPRVADSNPQVKANPGEGTTAMSGLSPQQAEWAEKAVKRYAESQEKKWQRWNEAMFIPEATILKA